MNEMQSGGKRPSVFVCVGKALCYLMLFLGWQTVVSMACTYDALYEASVGGVLTQDYFAGQRMVILAALGVGVLILAVWAVVMKARGRSLRRTLGLKDTAGPAVTALAAVLTALAVLGVMALVGRMVWQLVVGMLYLMKITMEGQMPDLVAAYEAVLERTPEISAVSAVLTLATLALFFRLRKKSLREEVWLRPASGKTLGWSAGLAFCLYWLVTLVLSSLPETLLEGYLEASAGLNETGLLMFLSTAILAPVVEEVVFRGLIYSRLQRGMRPLVAAVGAAFLFGYCHGDLVWFCYAFVLGLVFTQVTRGAGSILPALVMHVTFNLTNEIVALFGEWYPNIAVWGLILLVGMAGSLLCALRLYKSLLVTAQPEAAEEAAAHGETVLAPTEPQAPARPAAVTWDEDSGPDHKFPPNLR